MGPKATRLWRYWRENRHSPWGRLRGEDGRVLLLGLAASVLLSTLILMSFAVSGVYLEQRRLQRLADQTASLAASEMEDTQYYETGIVEGDSLEIESTQAFTRAALYLESATISPKSGLKTVDLVDVSVDSTRVEVTLQATGVVPVVLPLLSGLDEVKLEATGAASLKASFG